MYVHVYVHECVVANTHTNKYHVIATQAFLRTHRPRNWYYRHMMTPCQASRCYLVQYLVCYMLIKYTACQPVYWSSGKGESNSHNTNKCHHIKILL